MKLRAFLRSIRTPAAAAAAPAPEFDGPPEPERPGVYRCRSKACGYRFYRDPDCMGPDRWFGPYYADGTAPYASWHAWADIDERWFDCTGRTGLIYEHARLQDFTARRPRPR